MIYNDPALFAREAKKVTITLTAAYQASWNSRYVYVVIDGVKYDSATSLEVKAGTIIDCVANGSTKGYSTVELNGVSQNLEEGNDGAWHYYYTVHTNAVFAMEAESFPGGNTAAIRITELISFTIDGTTYQAEEGMTFTQWVNSSYNTDNFWINVSAYVISPLTNGYVREGINSVTSPSSTIENGKAYITIVPAGDATNVVTTQNSTHSGGNDANNK